MDNIKYYTNKDNVLLSGSNVTEFPEGFTEITQKKYDSIKKELEDKLQLSNEKNRYTIDRIQQLQDKAIIEGLTDAEKEEYKKLKGGE